MTDFIKLPRSALNDLLWHDGNAARLYLYLISVDGEPTSFRKIAKDTRLTLQEVRTALSKLKTHGIATQSSTQKATQILTQSSTQTTRCISGGKSKSATQKVTQKATQSSTQKATQILQQPEAYIDPRFAEAWHKWIEYRKEVRKPYKSLASEKTAYNKMVQMSGDDPEQALDMVDRAILGQWQGLHETRQYGTAKPHNAASSAKESRDRLQCLATTIVSRSENLLNLYNDKGHDTDAGPNQTGCV